jgi:hypothetical protein
MKTQRCNSCYNSFAEVESLWDAKRELLDPEEVVTIIFGNVEINPAT